MPYSRGFSETFLKNLISGIRREILIQFYNNTPNYPLLSLCYDVIFCEWEGELGERGL